MKVVKRTVLQLSLLLQISVGALVGVSAASAEDAAESRSASFQAVEGPTKEDVPGGPLLVAAYAFFLVAVVAYVARLGSLSAKNRAELERLTAVLERGRPGPEQR
ncbi:MAG: hypothetical protein JWN04_5495 [Myxococcaceae bacterium]|nr:hypothetical protein [Myxococcaceae bacterium]